MRAPLPSAAPGPLATLRRTATLPSRPATRHPPARARQAKIHVKEWVIGQRIRMAFGDKQPLNVKQVNNAELIAQGYPSEGWLLVRLGDNPIADHVGDFGQETRGSAARLR